MKRFTVVIVAIFLFAGIGCSTKFAAKPVADMPSAKLETGHAVYIALAADGRYSEQTYRGTGAQVSGYVAQTLSSYTSSSQVDNEIRTLEASLQNAKEANAKYLFVPLITHWEPRAAAWSGRPTRVNIELRVYDVESGQPVAGNSSSVRGRIVTVASQHAHELAREIVTTLVNSFY